MREGGSPLNAGPEDLPPDEVGPPGSVRSGAEHTESPLCASDLPAMTVASLMSGTSLDGIDALVVHLELSGGRLRWRVLGRHSTPYPAELRSRLELALKPETSDVSLITQLNALVGQAYADATGALLRGLADPPDRKSAVDLVALSGQTVYHIPRVDAERSWLVPSTLQLGEAAIVAERFAAPVVSDFRQSDLAAGGQGAPLVAFGDALLFGVPGRALSVHNLGGISNLSYLDLRGDEPEVLAFDTGPGNCLLDEAARRFLGSAYDAGGQAAARGRVDDGLLARWLEHDYLLVEPPKTTGRELFELDSFLPERFDGAGEDLLATLTAFTAHSIARAYRDFVLPRGLSEVLLAGGGAYNGTLVAMLGRLLPVPVRTIDELGTEPKDREALAFAVMAYFGYNGLPNTLPSATGARRAVVAGRITDHRATSRLLASGTVTS